MDSPVTMGRTVCQKRAEIRGTRPCGGIKSRWAFVQLHFAYDSNRSLLLFKDVCLKVNP